MQRQTGEGKRKRDGFPIARKASQKKPLQNKADKALIAKLEEAIAKKQKTVG